MVLWREIYNLHVCAHIYTHTPLVYKNTSCLSSALELTSPCLYRMTERRHMTYGLADITPDNMDMILQSHSFSIFQTATSTSKSLVYLSEKRIYSNWIEISPI